MSPTSAPPFKPYYESESELIEVPLIQEPKLVRNIRVGPDFLRTRSIGVGVGFVTMQTEIDSEKPTQIVCLYSDRNRKYRKRYIKNKEKEAQKIETAEGKVTKIPKWIAVEEPKPDDEPEKDPDIDLKPLTWNQAQFDGFFEALKVHGPNFTKIATEIGSNRFITSVFFKRYAERHPFV